MGTADDFWPEEISTTHWLLNKYNNVRVSRTEDEEKKHVKIDAYLRI